MTVNRTTARDALIRLVCSGVVVLMASAAHADDPANKPRPEAAAVGSRDDRQPDAGHAAPRSEAAEAWDAVKDSGNPALLEAFIKRYRHTFFAVIAMAQLADLRAAAAAKESPFPSPPSVGAVPPAAPVAPPAIAAAGTQSRAVLYDEDPNNPAGRQFVGAATWRTESIKAEGRPDELAVRADVDIPSRGLRLTMSFRRNNDASLPASHLVELSFHLSADAAGGGVANVPGILMKLNEQARGTPLAGLAVKVTGDFFLVGLSNVATDQQRNLKLLQERSWFDIPVVYANQRRGILAIDKGEAGELVFKAALTAWEQYASVARPAAPLPGDSAGPR
jgi:hypothetical protein